MQVPRLYSGDSYDDAANSTGGTSGGLGWQPHGPQSNPRTGITGVSELVNDVIRPQAERLAAHKIQVELDIPAAHRVYCDRQMLARCLGDLVENALAAMPAGGELMITSYLSPHCLELEVADSGPGLGSESNSQTLNGECKTGQPAGAVRLAAVRQLVAAHGGDVTAQNCPQGGAAYTIRLPHRALRAAA